MIDLEKAWQYISHALAFLCDKHEHNMLASNDFPSSVVLSHVQAAISNYQNKMFAAM